MPSPLVPTAAVALALLALPAGAMASRGDRNHDGLSDRWETRHHLSLKVNQSSRDQDNDGLNNRGERARGTDPRKADSDRDGLKDGMEVKTGNDPRKRDTDGDGIPDGRENAGTILSFANGVLTIKLADGSTISGAAGAVSCDDEDENEIENETTVSHHRRGATAKAASHGGSGGGSDSTENANEVGNEDANEAENEAAREVRGACSVTDLVAGAMVHEAKLNIGSAGAVFDEVEIVK
jgi:hypothetical protein